MKRLHRDAWTYVPLGRAIYRPSVIQIKECISSVASGMELNGYMWVSSSLIESEVGGIRFASGVMLYFKKEIKT